MKAVYRRDPRVYYGVRKTHGWIPTFQSVPFGEPVCDPQAVLTAIETRADEAALAGVALLFGTNGASSETVSSGIGVLVGMNGQAVDICE